MVHPALKAGNIAVVTGAGAGGIGFAVAKLLISRYSMKAFLADISPSALKESSDLLVSEGVKEDQFETRTLDVSNFEAVKELKEYVYEKEGKVDLLFANAGVGMATKDFAEGGDIEAWTKTLSVNLFGVLNCTQAFVQSMVNADSPAAVVLTGSKQGITQPPGNPAYNVSKSAVKSLAESLSHSLLPTKVTAHLLVPGYTYTKMTTKSDTAPAKDKKPAAAWTADQVAEELVSRMEKEFYIICPDNDVTWELDAARMEWNANDILQKRPALSRWHPEYSEAFAAFVKEKTGK